MGMTRARLLSTALALAALADLGAAQAPHAPADVAQAVREYRVGHEQPIVAELVGLLSIPNIASDEPNIRRNADLLKTMFERRGFQVRFFDVPKRGPVVFAELPAPGAARTMMFYAHYDGQPVDPTAWTGTGPFEPALRTGSLEAGGTIRAFPDAARPTRTTGGSTRARPRTTSRPSSPCSLPSTPWPRKACLASSI